MPRSEERCPQRRERNRGLRSLWAVGTHGLVLMSLWGDAQVTGHEMWDKQKRVRGSSNGKLCL